MFNRGKKESEKQNKIPFFNSKNKQEIVLEKIHKVHTM